MSAAGQPPTPEDEEFEDEVWLVPGDLAYWRPSPYAEVLRDHWWPKDRAGRVLVHCYPSSRRLRGPRYAPLCNRDRLLAERLGRRALGTRYAGVVQVPLALIPIDPSDF